MSKNFDIDYFEIVICYNSFNKPEYLASIIDYYDAKYFNNSDIKVVMDVIVDFFKKRGNIPNVTEINTLLPTPETKESLVNVLKKFKEIDRVYNTDELYENTETFLREKAVFFALLDTTKNLNTSKQMSPNDILETFNKACTISLVDNLGLNYFEDVDIYCDAIVRPNNTISTGWNWLDDKIGGGWNADGKALYVFTGFTNVGKSIFLGNIALNMLKQNKTIVLISLEMSELVYAKRMTCNLTGIGFNELKPSIEQVKEKIYKFKNEFGSTLIIKEFPTKGVTVNHINSFIQKLIKKGIKPDALVIDYLNLIKGTNKNKNESTYSDIKEIAEQLRGSTYLFNVPVITASQLGRSAAGKSEPGIENISESIGLSFTADAQFSIWASEDERKTGIINLGIQKNRFGPNFGYTPLKIDYNTLTLSELPRNVTSITSQEIDSSNDALSLLGKKLGEL